MQPATKFQLNRWETWAPVLPFALMIWAPGVLFAISPVLLSVLVGRHPDHFRTRSGSLSLAVGLIAFLWICVLTVVVISVLQGSWP